MDAHLLYLILIAIAIFMWFRNKQRAYYYNAKTNKYYLVRSGPDGKRAADMLAELEVRATLIAKHMGFDLHNVRLQELIGSTFSDIAYTLNKRDV